MTGKELARLAAALLLGAAAALPLELWLARNRDGAAEAPARPPRAEVGRAMYSPRIRDDPYFLDQQRKGIEALEAECRRTGAFCTEARQVRRRLEDQAAD
jgi:hypothetical protein